MTLEVLKSEALKLEKLELFDFAQFIIETLKVKDSSEFNLNEAQKLEITQRLKDIENNPTAFTSGLEVEKQLISKYGLEV